ncbi:MAG: hypothetical protein AABW54_00910 [Candidatus Micrarchaeota archaeon]
MAEAPKPGRNYRHFYRAAPGGIDAIDEVHLRGIFALESDAKLHKFEASIWRKSEDAWREAATRTLRNACRKLGPHLTTRQAVSILDRAALASMSQAGSECARKRFLYIDALATRNVLDWMRVKNPATRRAVHALVKSGINRRGFSSLPKWKGVDETSLLERKLGKEKAREFIKRLGLEERLIIARLHRTIGQTEHNYRDWRN